MSLLLLLLAGCGGGSGGDDNAKVGAPLPELAQDVTPSGARIDRRADNYFPGQPGDQWVYDRYQGAVSTGQQHVRTASAGSGGDLILAETSPGDVDTSTYRRTAEGLTIVSPFSGTGLNGLESALPSLLEYPEPFHSVGALRSILRQGSLGRDLDGDGAAESYRFEFKQTFLGFETVSLPTGPVSNAAHFRNVVEVVLHSSIVGRAAESVVATEDAWWAPGIGLVRVSVSTVDENGSAIEAPYDLVLRSGTVNGQSISLVPPDGTVRRIPLSHRSLVYDPTRAVYYASIPGSVAPQGNRIAIIDGATGNVSYSAPVGSEPSAMAMTADGSALYVGLDGSGEVVKLALPSMAEQSRTRLPVVPLYGQLRAESITASPTDADVVAVATYRPGVSPRHGGVALIRAGVLQARMTQEHTGSNLVVFDAAGQSVYGYNNETTEFGLRRIAVLDDGLQESLVVAAGESGFAPRSIDRFASGVLFGHAIYNTPSLTLRGVSATDGSGGCRWHSTSDRIVCLSATYFSGSDRSITVVDPVSLATLATPIYQHEFGSDEMSEIVPGPRGQVALRFQAAFFNSTATSVWLFQTPALP
jgi:DNA-binding beta-propeller fold protein YncE